MVQNYETCRRNKRCPLSVWLGCSMSRGQSQGSEWVRRVDPEATCDLSASISWPDERLDVPALGLLSHVMGVASLVCTTFPPSGIALEHNDALLVGSQSAPPSARVLNVNGFSWVIGEPVCGVHGRSVRVTEGGALLCDTVCTLAGIPVRPK